MKCKFEVLSKDEVYDIQVVDYGKLNVKMPSYLVEELVRRAPREYVFYGRNPKRKVECGGSGSKRRDDGCTPHPQDRATRRLQDGRALHG
jgi:trimethylamine:corrinoid methyltransferase-like protein